MKSTVSYTAMRVKQYGGVPSVEVQCIDSRTKIKSDCLILFKTLDEVIFLGAENLHPLIKAEMRQCALNALQEGKGKLQIEAKQTLTELESSRKRQANRARQFHDAIAGWSRELLSLNVDIQRGLDTPTIRSRIGNLAESMEKLKPKK
ncbi:hypothetical protein L1465_003460 [Salmonella enterica]|nr:hypothetical protein [Salmonella enterica subsp. enterica serovar Infantis]EFU3576654.1 hypothetical protein [Salmonella enterica]EEC5403863.1 hypothetical protein [Salmonella enterica subsp. enterica serovar Infantis]EFP2296272.1 hypothetical protein [Salmonella enterica subsp. enterica serovar Infantis]EIB5457880.1 hypothetical protein [Salmonella enterica subsp. enterica serovar Infantis]